MRDIDIDLYQIFHIPFPPLITGIPAHQSGGTFSQEDLGELILKSSLHFKIFSPDIS